MQKKVSSNSEEVEEVVWAFELLPSWWFAQAAALGVVVAVRCFRYGGESAVGITGWQRQHGHSRAMFKKAA